MPESSNHFPLNSPGGPAAFFVLLEWMSSESLLDPVSIPSGGCLGDEVWCLSLGLDLGDGVTPNPPPLGRAGAPTEANLPQFLN
jgi:hypothetical protein